MVLGAVSHQQVDAIGYIGGALLAGCFVPQIYQVIVTRSVHDISIMWSVLYSSGLALTTVYLIYKDAPAAWIPSVFELLGGVLVLALKLFFDHTAMGRRMCAARLQQQQAKQHAAQQAQANAAERKSNWGNLLFSDSGGAVGSFAGSRFASIFNQPFTDDAVVHVEDVSVRAGKRNEQGIAVQPLQTARSAGGVLALMMAQRLRTSVDHRAAREGCGVSAPGAVGATQHTQPHADEATVTTATAIATGAVTERALGPRTSGALLRVSSRSEHGSAAAAPAEPSM